MMVAGAVIFSPVMIVAVFIEVVRVVNSAVVVGIVVVVLVLGEITFSCDVVVVVVLVLVVVTGVGVTEINFVSLVLASITEIKY